MTAALTLWLMSGPGVAAAALGVPVLAAVPAGALAARRLRAALS